MDLSTQKIERVPDLYQFDYFLGGIFGGNKEKKFEKKKQKTAFTAHPNLTGIKDASIPVSQAAQSSGSGLFSDILGAVTTIVGPKGTTTPPYSDQVYRYTTDQKTDYTIPIIIGAAAIILLTLILRK